MTQHASSFARRGKGNHLNPPLSPFFKGGFFSVDLKPLFEKEGKGRFFAQASRNYLANFWVTPLATLMLLILAMGCDQLPGKPTPEDRWIRATEVTDFSQLYALNCSGCHGADGRLGAARPLNDPLYLALVSDNTLHQMIAQGAPGTAAPASAQQVGGPPTAKQIDLLIEGMRSR